MVPLDKYGAIGSAGNSNNPAAITVTQFAGIGSKIGAGDQVIDMAQEFVGGFVIQFIDIDHDGNSGIVRPPCGLKRGSGVTAVEMENSGVYDRLPPKLFNRVRQSRVPVPQYRSLSYTFLQENDGDLAGSSFNLVDTKFQPFRTKARQLRFAPIVGTNGSDVARSQTQPSARSERSGDLTTRFGSDFAKRKFGVGLGKPGYHTDRVQTE